jgi:hypothetical protein
MPLPRKITAQFSEGSGPDPIESAFCDDLGRPADGSMGVFPIISRFNNPPWKPVATGFFIHNNGFFSTAKHVLTDSRGQVLPDLAGVQLLRSENRVVIREIRSVALHPIADVAVGFLSDTKFDHFGEVTTNKIFGLTRKIPAVGARVVTFAFPESESVVLENGVFKMAFSTDMAMGEVEEYHENGRDSVLLPGRCYRVGMNVKFGASGGPVAFSHGYVFGINSTGVDGMMCGYVSSVLDILDVQVPRVINDPAQGSISVLELVQRGIVRLESDT